MKLLKLSARNFKGLSFDLDLVAINFLVGSNFAGKTARTDAIRLLLLGFLPELGKTPEATFGLASGREMELSGEFDDGTKIRRAWRAKGNSIVRENDLPPTFDERSEELVALMLNAETYFAKSERARVEYVARNVKLGDGWLPSEIIAQVERVALAGPDDDEAKKLSAILRQTLVNLGVDASPQEFVEAAIAAVDDAGKAAKAHAAKMEKTAQGLAALRANDAPAVDLGALDCERNSLLVGVSDLLAIRERHAAAHEAAVANRRRRAELVAAVAGKSRFAASRDALAGKIEAMNYELSRLTRLPEEEIERLRTEETDARASLRDHEKDLNQVRESIRLNEAALMAVDVDERCPYCGASGDGWKTLKRAEIASALAGLKTKEDQLAAHVAELLAQVESRAVAARDARAEAAEVRAVEATLANLQRDLESVEKNLAILAGKEEEMAHLPPEDAKATAAIEAAQSAIDAKNEALAKLDLERKAAMGRASELQRLAQAETDRDAARKEQKIAEVAVAKLREIQSTMVAEAFRPVLSQANRLFGHALKTPLEYNAEKSEIGTRRAGVWVGHKTFSGVEKLLCYAAIQMALAAKSPIRIMLLDEMLRAQGAFFSDVVAACKQAVRDHGIDQFVGVIPGEPVAYAYLGANSDSQVVAIE